MSPTDIRQASSDEVWAMLEALGCDCSLTPDGGAVVCYHPTRDPSKSFPLYLPKTPVLHYQLVVKILGYLRDMGVSEDEIVKCGLGVLSQK